MTRRSHEFAAIWCCCTALGCTTTDLGRGPEFLWWTDHESADFSDWTKDNGGYSWTADGGTLDVVSSPVRSGTYAIRASVISTSVPNKRSAAIISRNGTAMPKEAYYSAWFYIPEALTDPGSDYWLFFKFRSRNAAGTDVDLWDLDFMANGSAADMDVQLYSHGTDTATRAAAAAPIARWFQTEAFLRAANDDSGELVVWIDGKQLFSIVGRATIPTTFIEWSIGAATEVISPPTASLYFDDAAITTERLGPKFPAFWRNR